MELHLVGGFLGSGKTTAILEAARQLVDKSLRVGIITNEQGKHLVDTAFFRASGIPALEVTGGCICCNLNDFEERIAEITTKFDPQVLFAESVGSCTDLVATVIKPLSDYQKTSAHPASLSVFTDSRMLLRYLHGMELPFSEGITYIFEKQIEEASLLIVNKIDLLPLEDAQNLMRLAELRYPDKKILPQNSLKPAHVAEWLTFIRTISHSSSQASLDISYDLYAKGEASFAWVDREYEIVFSDPEQIRFIADWIELIVSKLESEKYKIAHLKFLITDDKINLKFNLTSQDTLEEKISALKAQLNQFKHNDLHLTLNLMVEGDIRQVDSLVDSIFQKVNAENQVSVKEIERFSRTPGFPKPTKRIA